MRRQQQDKRSRALVTSLRSIAVVALPLAVSLAAAGCQPPAATSVNSNSVWAAYESKAAADSERAGGAATPGGLPSSSVGVSGSGAPTSPAPTSPASSTPTASAHSSTNAATQVLVPASDKRTLRKVARMVGPYSPKSVTASGFGTVIAANMMYRHSISVFSSDGRLRKTVRDSVDLRKFGVPGAKAGMAKGAPVETAFSPDGQTAWISNYAMYGAGFGPEGTDDCPGRNSLSPSYLYRLDVRSKTITGVVKVGKTPKYVAATPDGKYVLVSNWCSYDLSIVDTASLKQVATIPLGPHPRGIAITKDSSTAYVAVMGGAGIRVVNLRTRTATWIHGTGVAPRHVVLSPDERWLYVSVNGTGQVVKVDRLRRKVVARATTGSQPRSLAIAPDGRSLYVVNYASGTMSKLRSSDMHVIETVKTDVHPIGITYDTVTNSIWVSCYHGVIYIFADK